MRTYDVTYTVTIAGILRVEAEEAYQAEHRVVAMPCAELADVAGVTIDRFVSVVREVVT